MNNQPIIQIAGKFMLAAIACFFNDVKPMQSLYVISPGRRYPIFLALIVVRIARSSFGIPEVTR